MIRNRIVFMPADRHNVTFCRAEGSYVFDQNGKPYIDLTSGWNVTNLGWNHPEVAEAIAAQARTSTYAPLWASDRVQEEYAEKLTNALPKELDACVKATSGTDSVESAIKIARAATGRKKIVAFKDTYHGHLFASLALGSPKNVVQALAPLVPDIVQLVFPREASGDSVEAFRRELDALLARRDVAAVVTEPVLVSGGGSMHVFASGFLKAVREITAKYGTLLIVDDVGTGFSRSGKLFGIGHEDVVPDMMCIAKAMSNGGAAIGAVIARSALIETAVPFTFLISTFGWTPVACAACVKTLEIHQRDKIWEQAQDKGDHMMLKLKAGLGEHPAVAGIRGRGMEVGVDISGSPALYHSICALAAERGIYIIGTALMNVIQLMPPLTISKSELDEGLQILIAAIRDASEAAGRPTL